RLPGAVDRNATRTTHVAVGFRTMPLHRSDVMVKSPGLAPVNVTAEMANGLPPTLVTVSGWSGVSCPRVCHPKSSGTGVTVNAGAPSPPTSGTSVVIRDGGVPAGIVRPSGLLAGNGVPVTSRSVAVRVPNALGEKFTETTHGVSMCRIA